MTEDEREGDAMSDAAVYGDVGPEVQEAAETLRTVESLRRRSASLTRTRAFPLWIWAASSAATLPFALFGRDVYESSTIENDSIVVSGSVGDHPKLTFIAVAVAAVLAAIVSIIDHRRQPVHRARERRPISVGEGIVLAAVIILVGPVFIASLFSVATTRAMAYVGASSLAVVVGTLIRNRALSIAAVVSLFGMMATPYIWANHWPALASGSYVASFSIAGLALSRAQRAA